MALVSDEDLINSLHLSRGLLGLAKRVLAIRELNDLSRTCTGQGSGFASEILQALQIRLIVQGPGLAALVSTRSVVVVCNHPFGLLDGLILIKLLGDGSQPFKILANYLLSGIDQLRDHLVAVNSLDDGGDNRSNTGNLRHVLRLAQAHTSVVLFPAGDVSSFRLGSFQVADRPWDRACVKLIRKLNLPVLPIHIEGRNSLTYQIMNSIHPKLGLLFLPRELLNKRGQTVRVTIGKPFELTPEELLGNLSALSETLRSRVYDLRPRTILNA